MSLIKPALDLSVYHWKHVHGDITAFGTWWLADKDPWPCMALVPTFARLSAQSVRPCVVSMDLAWMWQEQRDDTAMSRAVIAYTARTAVEFAETLGFAPDERSAMRVLTVIREHLGDLLSIPPRPKALTEIVADAVIRSEDGRERHLEIADHV